MDSTTTNLYPYLERTTKFIHSARMNGGNVYVHCSAGISRSSTVTLSYMMTVYDRPFLEVPFFSFIPHHFDLPPKKGDYLLKFLPTNIFFSFFQLLGHLRRMRSCVHPNSSFQQQLRQFVFLFYFLFCFFLLIYPFHFSFKKMGNRPQETFPSRINFERKRRRVGKDL